MKDRLEVGRNRLDDALEAMAMLCEPVQPPKGELEHIHYFCGNTEQADSLRETMPRRVALYKSVVALIRAYANISDDMVEAGYSQQSIERIKKDIDTYVKLREVIRQASGETLDLKPYEADMRHLIDTYIAADAPKAISLFGEMGLLDLIVKSGMADAINNLPAGIKNNPQAVAETIANNVRSKIMKDHLNDPAFYDKMSALLTEILDALRQKQIEYEEFLRRMTALATQVQAGMAKNTPVGLNTPGKRALYNNLGNNEALALKVDETVRMVKPDSFRGNQAKENVIKAALYPLLGNDQAEVERIFKIIVAQTEY